MSSTRLRSLLGVVLTTGLLLAACGNGAQVQRDGAPHDAAQADTAPTDTAAADATPTDAGANTAAGPDFSCAGMAPPTTAPDPLNISGTAFDIDGQGLVLVEVKKRADDAVVASTTSAAGGTYSLGIATAGLAVDAYGKFSKSGYVSLYLYPADPLSAHVPASDDSLWNQGVMTWEIIRQVFGSSVGVALDPQKGLLMVALVDCRNDPVAGATVSFDPAGGVVVYMDEMGPNTSLVATSDQGAAAGLNVLAGAVEVNAEHEGKAFRPHTVKTYAGGLTVAVLHP